MYFKLNQQMVSTCGINQMVSTSGINAKEVVSKEVTQEVVIQRHESKSGMYLQT